MTSEPPRKYAAKACTNCREHKAKCIMEPGETQCRRCSTRSEPCIPSPFPSVRGGRRLKGFKNDVTGATFINRTGDSQTQLQIITPGAVSPDSLVFSSSLRQDRDRIILRDNQVPPSNAPNLVGDTVVAKQRLNSEEQVQQAQTSFAPAGEGTMEIEHDFVMVDHTDVCSCCALGKRRRESPLESLQHTVTSSSEAPNSSSSVALVMGWPSSSEPALSQSLDPCPIIPPTIGLQGSLRSLFDGINRMVQQADELLHQLAEDANPQAAFSSVLEQVGAISVLRDFQTHLTRRIEAMINILTRRKLHKTHHKFNEGLSPSSLLATSSVANPLLHASTANQTHSNYPKGHRSALKGRKWTESAIGSSASFANSVALASTTEGYRMDVGQDIIQENFASEPGQTTSAPTRNSGDIQDDEDEVPAHTTFGHSYGFNFPEVGELPPGSLAPPPPSLQLMPVMSEQNTSDNQFMDGLLSSSPVKSHNGPEFFQFLMETDVDVKGVWPESTSIQESVTSSKDGNPEPDDVLWQLNSLFESGLSSLEGS